MATLKIEVNNNIYEISLNSNATKKWDEMIGNCFSAMEKAGKLGYNNYAGYGFLLDKGALWVTVKWKYARDLSIGMYWGDLLNENMLKEYKEKGLHIPEDLTAEQEVEICKEIMRYIWAALTNED